MKSKLVILLIVFILLVFNPWVGIEASTDDEFTVNLELENRYLEESDYCLDYKELNYPQSSYGKNIKGVYINFWALSNQKKRERIIKTITQSDLNAIVVDLKDIKGHTPFMTSNVKQISYNLDRQEFKEIIQSWQKKGIYVIGRLSVFKDQALATEYNNLSLKYLLNQDGKSVNFNSKKWSNPYSENVWSYNINIAQKMAELGLDEIQFDYVRFPTLSNESKLLIKSNDKLSKSDAIVGFLKEAKKSLAEYDIGISADLFGLTTTIKGDLGIGQDIVRIAKHVDYISPMLYPSHYSKGMYGIINPAGSPYQVIARSLADAKEKLGPASNKIRPWLQDFSLYHSYTEKEIRAQIKAVQDKELSSWLLWNPRSIYTIEAFRNKEERSLGNES
jgi:hypothetical protein